MGGVLPRDIPWHKAANFAFERRRRNLLHWASWAVALGLEIGLMLALRDGEIFGWEQSMARELQSVPGKRHVFDVTSTLTNTLSVPFAAIFLLLLGAVIASGHRGAAAIMLLSFPLHVLAQFPKAIIERPRPSSAFEGIEGVGGLQSFPSGHSEYVVTFYGFVAYLVVLHLSRRWQRRAVVAVWVAFVMATGFGRIAEGRHWPIDVLASYMIGLGLLSGLIWLHTAFRLAGETDGKELMPDVAFDPPPKFARAA